MLTHEFGFSENLDAASVNFLVSSILTKISKQYFFKLPQKALLLDNTNGDENSSSKQKMLEELFREKFTDVSVFNTHKQKGAYLLP